MSTAAAKLPFESQKTEHRIRSFRSPVQFLILLGIGTLLAASLATQWVAHQFGYHPNLGVPVLPTGSLSPQMEVGIVAVFALLAAAAALHPLARRFSLVLVVAAAFAYAAGQGPLYSPVEIFTWLGAYKEVAAATVIVQKGLEMMIYGMALTVPALLMPVLLGGGGVKRASTAHGSAELSEGSGYAVPNQEFEASITIIEEKRAPMEQATPGAWSTPDAAKAFAAEKKLRFEPGILIGRHDDGRVLRYSGDSHILTMAPTRSGKGVGAVIPNLLTYPGSVVVTDPKGENFEITHLQRLRMGQRVFALDPFRVTGDHEFHASYNLLDRIDIGDGAPREKNSRDDADNLAKMMILEKGGGGDGEHWILEAQSFIVGLLLYIKTGAIGLGHGPRPTDPAMVQDNSLMELRRLMTLPPEGFADLFEWMSQSKNEMVARSAARLMQKDEKERSGVISTAQAHTAFLDSALMKNVMGGDLTRHVPLDELKKGPPMSIYLILPPEYLKSHAAWLRLMVTASIDALTRTTGKPAIDVLFLLDEFANLGRMEPVKQGVSLVGGYGAKFWMLIQDLSQLKGVYKDDYSTIFANCDIKQTYGTNDYETAKLLSDMMGDATVLTEGVSEGKNRSFGKSSGSGANTGSNISEKGRKLLMPEEVMKLPKAKQLLFVKGDGGTEAMVTDKLVYYRDPEFAHQFGTTQMMKRGV